MLFDHLCHCQLVRNGLGYRYRQTGNMLICGAQKARSKNHFLEFNCLNVKSRQEEQSINDLPRTDK